MKSGRHIDVIGGFRTKIFLSSSCLFAVPFGLSLYGASLPEGTGLSLLIAIVIASGLLWIGQLIYLFFFLVPKCPVCRSRTRKHGTVLIENEKWEVVKCEDCVELYRYPSLGGLES